MKSYEQILDDIYNRFPVYQQVGQVALKPGLDNITKICQHIGNPERSFKVIHVAGTNGKGSVSHSIAAILQSAGYVTGLFTSPHLVDFRERIRVDGCMIDKDEVVGFFDRYDMFLNELSPSFFEIVTGMAFDYFHRMGVEVAVVEVGLGGRLDSTNIVEPDLSIITNIGLEHTQYLGDTLAKIATEKGGIIKSGHPVVIGERHDETDPVFERIAQEKDSSIVFAQDILHLVDCKPSNVGMTCKLEHVSGMQFSVDYSLTGLCQTRNILTVMAAVDELRALLYDIPDLAVREGLRAVQELTGLQGRWQRISSSPDIIADTGHNEHGVRLLAQQLSQVASSYRQIHIVWGMSSDKNPEKVIDLLPKNARYYFTQAGVRRATPAADLYDIGLSLGLDCHFYPTVRQAFDRAKRAALKDDLILVGGSNFVVAEVL